MNKHAVILPFLLATLVAAPAFADPPPAGKVEAQARFKQTRAEILRKRLGLDEKKAGEVEKVLDKYAPERKKLRQAMRDQQKALRELLKNKSEDQPAYKRALDSLTDNLTRLNTLRQQEQAELSRLMTPKQQAQLLEVMGRARRAMRGHGPR
ncbi:MAG TPA: periplasmic heavy metal sensor [Polyangiaceae bacterium]|jgi:Spy/CpxP family protein refolding chaperone|nr:periplasmic heavy metal sensor [Polyangiaceae bacterium]